MNKHYIIFLFLLLSVTGFCQVKTDTIKTNVLKEVKVNALISTVERLPGTVGTRIWAGKKSEVLNVQGLDANIAEKTPRQIFSKVPGVFVYDMDGSGNQVNIAVRGLDPHRGWEFNIRKNGVITNSDMYGYPASHYSMPMEAVDHIELVRGTGSLQYGAQFGGMLNYVTKQPDTTKTLSFESINTAGSFGLLSTYNAVSGRKGKFDYYAYYSKRVSNGYRDNGNTNYDAQGVTLIFNASDKVKLKAEFARSNYVYRIPGPLTDSMFYADPRQSTRERNYFNPDIYIPSLNLEWALSERTQLSVTTSAVLGDRNSVQFDKPADIRDSINALTMQYNSRQVDQDHFNSYTADMNLLHKYKLLNNQHSLAFGVQLFNNDLHRQQLGKGTTGSDFDLSIAAPGWGRDLHFKTKNIAVYAENSFRVSPKFTVSPGIRWESGHSDMTGTISYYDPGNLPNTINHNFVLLGINAQYELSKNTNFYTGFAQSYRPIIFKDIIPASIYEAVDKDLKDASGYTAEAGFRGSAGGLKWDVSVFHLKYNNRMGSLSTQDDAGNFILYRTNIGDSYTNGLEWFTEYGYQVAPRVYVNLFTSTAFMRAKYKNANVKSGNTNINADGNKVESVPSFITRNGAGIKFYGASISLLYSYTAKSYADALNTEKPSANGSVGLVPSYGIFDINTSYRFNERIMMRLNINNATNKQYFTKRPAFYPGPGVWSSDGRSVNVSVGFKL